MSVSPRLRGALVQFGVTLAAVLVGLGAYALYNRPQRQATQAQIETLRTQAERTRAEAAALARQSGALADQGAALGRQVEEEHQRASAERERYLAAALLAEGFVVASNAKTAVAEYYMNYGKLPASNRDIGLPAADRFRGQSLRSMAIAAGGRITLTYDAKSGVDGGTIELVPDTSNPAMGIRWRCVTSSYEHITVTIPQCEFQAREPHS